ncbi:MAG: autotransporter-associated beta strand repeat-containing protein [Akkermansiaceae bacterium]|jgi:fibronectin-binding autotransporter adhesin|nr:autotransporter-associated beta strand repeat-containing protein [Akkermansiaceae bacterium]MDP4647251.1 autotransporter-associated beta strand repeat-containing protein [Akkermansiaceae bacterium]MDP4722523.1 autotransporter-associated beta strand repeat-containing protein [Akkermansiaceae bacterium]MDP4781031.1 autotransporter-associated beta strand repeat-containing protein [Akkermansiaceae bacterium]MDP4898730.1 autotransporter-associated beta strand repeat-containing protein [Akkermansi
MKYSNVLIFPASLVLMGGNQALAVDYYWDNDGTTAGFGTASGTWAAPTTGDSTQGWSTDSTGATLPGDVTTTTSDNVFFGSDTLSLASGNITLSGTVDANFVYFGKASGSITLSGGTINVGSGFQAPTGVGSASSTHTINSDITKTGGNIRFGTQSTSGENYIVNGIVSGTSSLDIRMANNSAYLALNGVNTFSGNVGLVTGQLNVNTLANSNVASSLGQGSVVTMGGGAGQTPLLWYTGATAASTDRTFQSRSTSDNRIVAQDGAADFTGILQGGTGTATYNFNFAGTADTGMNTVSGTIQDGTSSTIRVAVVNTTPVGGSAEAGTWEFSGNNTYTGITLVTGNSTLIASSATALGATDGGTTVNSGSLLDVRADIGTEALSIAGVGQGGIGALITSTGTGTVGGSVTMTADSSVGGAGNLNVGGAIGGAFALTKVGTGTTTLSGANTFTGATILSNGTLTADQADVAATSGALGNGGDITFSGGTLNYTANSASTDYSARIAGSGSAISIDTNGENVTFGTALANTNTGGLTKTGAGQLDIRMGNSYTGTTTINGGTLKLTNTADLGGFGSSNFNINNGSSLVISSAVGGANRTTVNNGTTFTFGSTGGGSIVYDGGTHLWQNSNGKFVTTGGAQNTVSSNNGGFINPQNNNTVEFDVADGTDDIDLLVSVTTVSGNILKGGAGTMSMTSNSTLGGGSNPGLLTITAGTFDIGGAARLRTAGAGLGVVSSDIVNDGTFKHSSSAVQELAGIISGSGGIIQDGSGDLTLSGSNSYTGATTVSSGTLFVNGSLGATDVSVASGAILGGTGSIAGTLDFDGASFLNIVDIGTALAVTGNVTFGSGFGINNLTGWDLESTAADTYTLISGSNIDFTNLDNVGLANAVTLGNGNKAYFQNGSLQLVIIPEPSVALLSALGVLALFRRRR